MQICSTTTIREQTLILTDCCYLVGWLYTILAGLMLLSGSLIMLVWWKGGQWRKAAETREAEHASLTF